MTFIRQAWEFACQESREFSMPGKQEVWGNEADLRRGRAQETAAIEGRTKRARDMGTAVRKGGAPMSTDLPRNPWR